MSSPAPADRGLLRRLQDHAPTSTQLIGLAALLILLFFAGVTVLSFILLSPAILLTSPIWVPAAAFLLVAGGGLVLVLVAVVSAAAGVMWSYKYLQGRHPPGSERVDYARGRVKEYAREYGGYLQNRVRSDVAPGA